MRHGRIVVGVGETGCGRGAARFALAAAGRRGAEVVSVCAIPSAQTWVEGYDGHALAIPVNLDDATRTAESRVRGMMLDEARSLGPALTEVPVHGVADASVPALLDGAREADLFVVGHRIRGAVADVHASVGAQCAHRAPCPVVIVPERSATGDPVREPTRGAPPARHRARRAGPANLAPERLVPHHVTWPACASPTPPWSATRPRASATSSPPGSPYRRGSCCRPRHTSRRSTPPERGRGSLICMLARW